MPPLDPHLLLFLVKMMLSWGLEPSSGFFLFLPRSCYFSSYCVFYFILIWIIFRISVLDTPIVLWPQLYSLLPLAYALIVCVH